MTTVLKTLGAASLLHFGRGSFVAEAITVGIPQPQQSLMKTHYCYCSVSLEEYKSKDDSS
jgi:hypothetical protein